MIRGVVQRVRYSRPVGLVRYHAYRLLLSWPRRVECNLCGWRGQRFLTYLHRHVLCPTCGSQVRHRLIAAALDLRPDRTHRLALSGKRLLHLSPEYCLAQRFRRTAGTYVAADFVTASANIRVDVMRLPFLDATIDVFVACDVLEHIDDDQLALKEVHRVLRPGGVAVLTVPNADGLAVTWRDPAIATPSQREEAFGQIDHVRLYGDDFASIVAEAGFLTTVFTAADVPDAVVRRHVLRPPEPLPMSWASNDRAIVFAQRPLRDRGSA